MGSRLNRNLGPVSALVAKEWTSETATGIPAICCPGCEAIVDFDVAAYQITHEGVIAPKWSCGFPSCSYREWITLGDFGEEVLR